MERRGETEGEIEGTRRKERDPMCSFTCQMLTIAGVGPA